METSQIDWDSDDLPADLSPVARQAIDWFGLMHADDVTQETRGSFVEWLGQSPKHSRAYDEIERVWRAAEGMSRPRPDRSISRRNLILGAIGVVGAGALGGRLATSPFADLRTGTGSRLSATLPDGTIVDLASRTVLDLDFSADRRIVNLLEGEAFFAVASDPSRPFSVIAGDGRVTALGTAFSVARNGRETEVTVTEHSVQVDLNGTQQEVGENQQLRFADELGEPVAVDPSVPLAWREGRLVFVSRPFGAVVDALNRWRDGQIIVADNALLKRPVTVIVDLEATGDDLLDQLQAALPIRVVRFTPLLTFVFAA